MKSNGKSRCMHQFHFCYAFSTLFRAGNAGSPQGLALGSIRENELGYKLQ